MVKWILTSLAIIAWCGTAVAGEEVVTIDRNGLDMVGTLETPDGDPAPVVVLLHGFSGVRDELPVKDTGEGVFERTARMLAEAGYASLRIDFVGSGDSGGAWPETTFQSQIGDAIAAVDWLKASDAVDGERIALLGWSQGGLVAAHVAAARPEVRSVTLWAPVVNPMLTFGGLFGSDTVAEAQELPPDTPVTRPLPWGVETTLNASFFHALPVTSTAGAISDYEGPLQVIVGERDTVVFPQPASGQMLLDYHDGEEILTVLDTDHIFDVFNTSSVLDGQTIPASINWISSHF